jgi:hypothetical protein
MSYPVAFWGFLFSLLFMIGWSMAAGMSWSVAAALWLSYLIMAICLSRVVIEGGLLFVQPGWTPLGALAQIVGSGPGKWLAPSSIAPGSVLQSSMIIDMRAFLMPSFLHSFKLAHDHKIRIKPLMALVFTCILISFVMSVWMNVRLGYDAGGSRANKWFATEGPAYAATRAAQMIAGVQGQPGNILWLVAGALLTSALMWGNARIAAFALHPLGYLVSVTYPLDRLWFSIFIGWLAKTIVMRSPDATRVRRSNNFFLGIVLGAVTAILMWLIIDSVFGIRGHQFMPS